MRSILEVSSEQLYLFFIRKMPHWYNFSIYGMTKALSYGFWPTAKSFILYRFVLFEFHCSGWLHLIPLFTLPKCHIQHHQSSNWIRPVQLHRIPRRLGIPFPSPSALSGMEIVAPSGKFWIAMPVCRRWQSSKISTVMHQKIKQFFICFSINFLCFQVLRQWYSLLTFPADINAQNISAC